MSQTEIVETDDEKEQSPIKINRLKITNVQGVQHVEILANPLINEMAGANQAGKSSILNTIVFGMLC